MIFRSVCSGIEAASVAWKPLGWHADAVAEIEKFPMAVLAHHYPAVPNLGDITKFREWPDANFDVLVGGTPCQSFSVAGLRKGLADPRGNLALVYLGILDRYRPRWMVWENVPGVLSSNEGRDFGAFLGGLAQLGYGFAYRVLDAQFIRVDGFARAVPQRRRRVFVIGHIGDWRRAAAVLFERDSLQGNTAPCREAGKRTAPTLSARTKGGGGLGTDFDCDGGLVSLNDLGGVSHALTAKHSATGRYDPNGETFVAHSLRGGGFDASEDGTGRGKPIIPIAFRTSGNDGCYETGDAIGALNTNTDQNQHIIIQPDAVAFDMRGREGGSQFEGPHHTANIRAASGGSSRSYVAQSWAVRRLTPLECTRLQGFPDGYFDLSYRGKHPADGPIYKALGNSMAIPPMRWIGQRIAMVDDLQAAQISRVGMREAAE